VALLGGSAAGLASALDAFKITLKKEPINAPGDRMVRDIPGDDLPSFTRLGEDRKEKAEIEALGYNVETHGQKGFNGVALLSKLRFDEVIRGLPGDDTDEQARFIEGVFSTDKGALRVASLYLPNGNPIDDERKFPYKLSWMARLERWAEERLRLEEALVMAGDYNVIPEPADARFPENWRGDALFQPQTRQAFRRLKNLGFTEAVRAVTDSPDVYTFWDYQAGAWQKNNGIRIDHLLLSPEAANRFSSASVEKHVRAWEKPSDHVPVAIDLDLQPA
jgi:exodeoxyribonuclease-3